MQGFPLEELLKCGLPRKDRASILGKTRHVRIANGPGAINVEMKCFQEGVVNQARYNYTGFSIIKEDADLDVVESEFNFLLKFRSNKTKCSDEGILITAALR